MVCAKIIEFVDELHFLIFTPGHFSRFRFDDYHRCLPSFRSNTHKCAARDVRMFVEDCFAADGIQYPVFGDYPVRFSSAEPQPPLFIIITDVSILCQTFPPASAIFAFLVCSGSLK